MYINLVLSICRGLFSPSTAFAGEILAWWEVAVQDLLNQRSPTLFTGRIVIDDNVDVHGVTSLLLVFPPLFVGIEFLFEHREGVLKGCRFWGPGR